MGKLPSRTTLYCMPSAAVVVQAWMPARGRRHPRAYTALTGRPAGNVAQLSLSIFKHPLNGRHEAAIFADCLWLALGWGRWRRPRRVSRSGVIEYSWEPAPHADGSVEPPPNAAVTPAPYQGRPADAEEAK